MKLNSKKLIALAIISSLALSYIFPAKVEARISFNRFRRTSRRLFRKIKQGTKFVIDIPDKATRWMGPVLGPIASTALTGNIVKNPKWGKVFNRAQQINRNIETIEAVEEKQQYLKDLRETYRDQAVNLRKQAADIRESRRQMLNQLGNGKITYADYKKHVIALNEVAALYEKVANKFDDSANNMKAENVLGIFSKQLLNSVWGEVKASVIYETSKELDKLIDPNVIQSLINNRSLSVDQLIDAFISQKIDQELENNQDVDADDLKNRVRAQIKDILENNRAALKNNWQEKINEIINQNKKELEKEKAALPETSVKPENTKSNFEVNPDSADKCSQGYSWDIKVGSCIQQNCSEENIPHAHYSYVKDCVCGTSGSINEQDTDPNQECRYPSDFEACPGCVYACVGIKETCPDF